jgi:hypothetical protein
MYLSKTYKYPYKKVNIFSTFTKFFRYQVVYVCASMYVNTFLSIDRSIRYLYTYNMCLYILPIYRCSFMYTVMYCNDIPWLILILQSPSLSFFDLTSTNIKKFHTRQAHLKKLVFSDQTN